MPTWRRFPPLPRRTRTLPRARSRSLSANASASLMRRPARHRTTISARVLRPCAVPPATRMTATISSTAGGSAGYRRPLLRGGRPQWNPGMVAGHRRRPPASSKTESIMDASVRERRPSSRRIRDCWSSSTATVARGRAGAVGPASKRKRTSGRWRAGSVGRAYARYSITCSGGGEPSERSMPCTSMSKSRNQTSNGS
jgi:hypothetical protein